MSAQTDPGALARPRPPAALLRPLRLSDLPAVMQIEQRAYSHPWSESIMRDCFKAGHQSAALEFSDRLLGYGWLSCAVGEAHILNVTIDPSVQGKGYGRRLMRRLLDVARWYRAEAVLLEVRISNKIAFNLYQSMGFVRIGERRAYYPADHGREDAVVMALTLLPPTVI
jgi:ribosomal-protein-alanine N-acetyltransferase